MLNSHVLVTGSRGFVGRHLSDTLVGLGARVSQIIRSAGPGDHAKTGQYIVDLTDAAKVVEVFSSLQPNYVVHLAGSKNRENDISQFRDVYNKNVLTSLNVIDSCRILNNFKRLIFLGTCDEYGQAPTPYDETQRGVPTSAYGLSKLAVTQVLSRHFFSDRFPSVVLRPTVIYGPGQGSEMFLSALIQSLLAGKSFAMTAGEQRRDFVYISDVVDAIVKAINADERVNGAIINVGAGISFQVKEVAAMVGNLVDSNMSDLIRFGALQYRPNEVMNYSAVITRAQELLDWEPSTNIRDGVKRTVEQFKRRGRYA